MNPLLRRVYTVLSLLFVAVPAARAQSPLNVLLSTQGTPGYAWFASTDASHHNEDYVLLKPGETKRVSLSAGDLVRLWSTSSEPAQLTLQLGSHLLLKNGVAAQGHYADKSYLLYVQGDYKSVRSVGGISPSTQLVATNNAKVASKWFYQVSIRPFYSEVFPDKVVNVSGKTSNLTLQPGQQLPIFSSVKPGQITNIAVSLKPGASGSLQQLRLQAHWEGMNGVDAPLLALAGAVEGASPFQNAIANYDGKKLQLKWPMPYSQGQLWLSNTGSASIDVTVAVHANEYAAAPSIYRFCAEEGRQLSQKGQPISIMKATGQGALVGLALSIAPVAGSASRTFAFLEGNEVITADGKLFEGTGTEDYFSSAWYFPSKPYSGLYNGLTSKTMMPPSISAYRLMIPDFLPFRKSIRFDFEHDNGNHRSDLNFHWVAFWYQKPPLVVAQTRVPDTNAVPGAPSITGGKPKSVSLWWAVVAGIVVGILLHFSKVRRGKRAK